MNQENSKSQNEDDKRINLDEVVEDEFNLSKKKTKINDSNESSENKKRVNLNEDI